MTASRARVPIEFDAETALAGALEIEVSDLARPDVLSAAFRRAWERATDAEKAVLSALVGLGGAAPAAWVAAEAAEELDEASGQAEPGDSASAESALQDLWARGVVARDRDGKTFYLLPPLALAAAALLRERAAWPSAPPAQPAFDEHLLCCAFDLARHEPLKVTRDLRPHARSLESVVRRLGPLLDAGADGRGAAERAGDVLVALRQHGLLRGTETTLEADEPAALAWAALRPRERAARLLSGTAPHAASAALLLRQLQVVAREARIDRRTSARLLRRAELRQSGFDLDGAAPGSHCAPAALRHDGAVAQLEWAGLADARGGAVTLTAAGRAFPQDVENTAPVRFHVGSDLAVLVPRGLPPATHLGLGAFARLEVGDVVARYRLERPLVLEALDRGATPAGLVALLEAHAATALPESVRRDLERWSDRFGEVSAHEGIALACEDSSRHAEFAAVVEASALPVRLVAAGVAVVATPSHEAFRRELVAAGFTPRRPAGERHRLEDVFAPVVVPDMAALPAWGVDLTAGTGRRAAPPTAPLVALLKEKYRREFGGGHLAALDGVDVDDLIAMEERGRTRQFLASQDGRGRPPVGPSLADYAGDEPIPVTAARAREVLTQAVTAGARCQVDYLLRPGGRRARMVIEPLEVRREGTGGYVLAKLPGEERRMLALERVAALRVLLPSPGKR